MFIISPCFHVLFGLVRADGAERNCCDGNEDVLEIILHVESVKAASGGEETAVRTLRKGKNVNSPLMSLPIVSAFQF
jgi:hypothetical protein